MYFFALLISSAIVVSTVASSWNNLNCPAPRAPDNGLSFIFQNGEVVRFRCHPGYYMQGKSVSHCVNNVWTHSAPDCFPILKGHAISNPKTHPNKYLLKKHENLHQKEITRPLFGWGTVYGDGPRRLPLINGIWPPQEQAERVLTLGPQSTPAPRTMIKEEVDIAELRNRQYEELRQQRHQTEEAIGRRKEIRKYQNVMEPSWDDTPRETVISLGNTEDGQALSVALAKPSSNTHRNSWEHKHRHKNGRWKQNSRKQRIHHSPIGYSNDIISRKSRVDTSGVSPYFSPYPSKINSNNARYEAYHKKLSEFKRKPVQEFSNDNDLSSYDATCTEVLYGREVPMIAPHVTNGFVYHYETKKNKLYPYNRYMEVKYRCLNGFKMTIKENFSLFCKKNVWTGELPQCA